MSERDRPSLWQAALRTRLLLVAAALLPVVGMAVAVEDFVRDVVVIPLLYAFWIAKLLFDSIPRHLLWAIFVGFLIRGAVRSLSGGRRLPATYRGETQPEGRVTSWARVLDEARRTEFARWHLSQRLGQLMVEVLAARQHVAPRQIVRQVEQGRIELPPEMRSYLRARLHAPRGASSFRLRSQPSPLAIDPEHIVRFLEETLDESPEGFA